MISSFYESRFTADRLGGSKKCIDFVFKRQWPLAAILQPNKTLLSVLLKTRISSTYTFKLRMPGADRPRHYFYLFLFISSTASPIPDSTITPTAIQIRSPVRGFLREPRETGTGGT